MTPSSRQALRQALGLFATGVTVVTAHDDDGPRGMTANAFMSGSLEPPLVLVGVRGEARLHATIERAGAYGVSILPESLEREARRFAGLWVGLHEPEPRFAEREGVPVLAEALAWFSARVVGAVPVGDHTLFVGEVVAFAAERPDEAPLAFFRSGFTGVRPAQEPPLAIDPWGWEAAERWG